MEEQEGNMMQQVRSACSVWRGALFLSKPCAGRSGLGLDLGLPKAALVPHRQTVGPYKRSPSAPSVTLGITEWCGSALNRVCNLPPASGLGFQGAFTLGSASCPQVASPEQQYVSPKATLLKVKSCRA